MGWLYLALERRKPRIEFLDRLQRAEQEQVVVHTKVVGLVGVADVVLEPRCDDRSRKDCLQFLCDATVQVDVDGLAAESLVSSSA